MFLFVYRLAGDFRQGVVCRNQFQRQRAGLAGTNHAPVNLDDWHDFRASAGEETFVRVE